MSNFNALDETGQTRQNDTANTTAAAGTASAGTGRASNLLNNVTSKVGDLVHTGTDTLRNQYDTVRKHGVEGVRRDITDYARKEPMKALLVAGGIGALAALILRRR